MPVLEETLRLVHYAHHFRFRIPLTIIMTLFLLLMIMLMNYVMLLRSLSLSVHKVSRGYPIN